LTIGSARCRYGRCAPCCSNGTTSLAIRRTNSRRFLHRWCFALRSWNGSICQTVQWQTWSAKRVSESAVLQKRSGRRLCQHGWPVPIQCASAPRSDACSNWVRLLDRAPSTKSVKDQAVPDTRPRPGMGVAGM
jgi:hypothetical protein